MNLMEHAPVTGSKDAAIIRKNIPIS